MGDLEYAGFWVRTAATLIDTFLMLIIILPVLSIVYGQDYWLNETAVFGFWDVLLNYILPALVVVLFWTYKAATPGKMALKLAIVDAKTGGQPTTGQLVGRYLAYYVSLLPLCLGIVWVGIDKRKQGWHDKLAGTVVVRCPVQEPVRFDDPE